MKKTILTSIFVLGICISLMAQSSVSYDYVAIVAGHKNISISYSNGEFEERKVSSSEIDYTDALKIVNEFEAKGYELYTNEFETYGTMYNKAHNYFLLRKKKN